ncbi:MAG: FAD-dependent oxidoreductase [Alphaproteobacteria bacterium]|nr:FAD-dependent oxidoreductase [Alphaproteobacteria bacterium]
MSKPTQTAVNRRSFLTTGAAGAVAAGAGVTEVAAQGTITWDQTADVVIVGAGVAGLPAAITARDLGASVIVVDGNYDIGGRGMLSGGRVQLGGGHALQQKFNIKDTADQVFMDWVRHDDGESRYSDRDLVRVFADENVSTYQFLLDNGVEFIEKPIGPVDASTLPRIFVTKEWHIPAEVVAPHRARNGSGLVRRLTESARKKGATILLKHRMTRIIREQPMAGRVLGIEVKTPDRTINIRATKGVIVATGGHTGNVNFRRMFDPRLTEEYQQACEPYVSQDAGGELAAMDIGASLWATAIQTTETGAAITKTRHIGCRWGYSSLVYETDSVMFPQAKATGLTVKDWQDVIMVNQFGKRFWDENDDSHNFFNAAMAYSGDKSKLNGGGPIWAIFDVDGAAREKWNTKPPNVDPDGWFYSADTLSELAGKIKSQYQKQPMPGTALADTVTRYNTFVAEGVDKDFKKKTPMFKIEKPPFYAAWATPILHDALTGLRTTTDAQVVDTRGQVIAGLYCAGESQGGFAQHGLARCLVFGRVAGRHAAKNSA